MLALKKHLPWFIFILSLIVLYLSSYPAIGWWDSSINAANAYDLSIPDPGGSILYVILGRLFTILFFFLPAIKAITLVSIVSTSAASVFFYYCMIEVLNNFNKSSESSKIIASFFTALSLPLLFSIWSESNVSRVYSLGLLLASIILLCALKIWLTGDEKKKAKLFLLIIFLIALDYTAHRLNMPFIPVIILLLAFPLRKHLSGIRFWLLLILVAAAGLSIHIFLLVRSMQTPPFRMDDIKSFRDLISWINMVRYGESNLSMIFQRRAPFWDYQIKFMYLRYFGWNFLGTNSQGILRYFVFLPFILGIAGFIYSFIKKIKVWTLISIIFLLFSFGLIVYANIQGGFDKTREIDRLFIPSFMIFLLWVGIGLFLLTEGISKILAKLKYNTSIIILSAACFFVLPLNLFLTNLKGCYKSKFYFPEDFAYNILSSCEKNAVLFTNGDNDTFPLLYLQSVEGYRTDVSVANVSLLNTEFFVNELVHDNNGFKIDTSFPNSKESGPALLKQPVEILLPYSSRSIGGKIEKDTLRVTYKGRSFGDTKFLLTQDKVILSFLKNNIWKRPVYFCTTVNPDNLLGLDNYLRDEGIVNKLVPVKSDSIAPSVLEYNLIHKYMYRSFNDSTVVIDNATKNIFNIFRIQFSKLILFYKNNGNKSKAKEIFDFMQEKLPEWRFTGKENEFLNELTK
ncbi:MAG: DUF2723 domain-containing protein [Ignavibacteriaceae bacterium]